MKLTAMTRYGTSDDKWTATVELAPGESYTFLVSLTEIDGLGRSVANFADPRHRNGNPQPAASKRFEVAMTLLLARRLQKLGRSFLNVEFG